MLFGKGNKVRFIHTGEEGVIISLMDNNMYQVLTLDGVTIPAFAGDLERIRPEENYSTVKGKLIRIQKKTPRTDIPLPNIQYELLKSEGILLGFVPVKRDDGSTQRYVVYLINATRLDALFDIKITTKDKTIIKKNGVLAASQVTRLVDMLADTLSDNPKVEASCRESSTAGLSDWKTKSLRLKPKQFFSRHRTAPLLGVSAFVYNIFEDFDKTEKEESLKSYTKKKLAQKEVDQPYENPATVYSDVKKWTLDDIQSFAEFPTDLDLHIENLTEDYASWDNARILNFQMTNFENYIDKAVLLGIPRVFVIHGIGKGVLKNNINTILSRLKREGSIQSFSNDFHPKYGNGATEVVILST